ncbi:hypothetical protein GCM10011507_02310 [Edaphobacter acidisoli]|uniref:Choice-of-anchor D domain-containing protein n=2 Tax=Edaphobacter acidisoli TaxID=2040573 RepID=A0A916RFX8_9BACT|nr:hypothetical protein GCM10011507_02310 [Edaphobacter acidisoli]
MKLRALCLALAGTFGLLVSSLSAQNTGPQQLLFAGLRSVANQGQFNAVQADAGGDLYLLLDQKDGVRIIKTDPTATTVLAQAQFGAKGDIGLAMALDPAGNVYVTGTAWSGVMASTPGAAFPTLSSGINSFIGKFDANLNPVFVTFCGSGQMAATGIAATADAVFVTGSIFNSGLPVTPSAVVQTPASGSSQNGFVEKFNASGTTLLYATYLSGENGTTAPAAIAADASDNAYIAGYTTSTGYPTLAAVVPRILGTSSGFLTKLTPAGDGITFSTFIPGSGVTSLVLDSAAGNLLLSGSIALGQFPVSNAPMPLVNTAYQSVVRMTLDGSTVVSSTVVAPGTQSVAATASGGAAWVVGSLPASMTGPLLPLEPLAEMGNSFAVHVTAQNTVDQTARFGGLANVNPNYASAPVSLTSLAVDGGGEPVFAGSLAATASSSLLATETWDLPLTNATSVLPSSVRNAALASGTCNGSECAGDAAYLAKLGTQAGASLALSVDDSPNITLRNLGTSTATGLQISTTGFTENNDCLFTLAPGADCSIMLTGSGPGSITVQSSNAVTETATLPATTNVANPIAVSAREMDFGVVTGSDPAATRILTVTNLGSQAQTFTSSPSTTGLLTRQTTDCAFATVTTSTLAPGASCHITLALSDSANTPDGFVQTYWPIGSRSVLLTGYTQAAALDLSASEIDFGAQFPGGLRLPRYLYISNDSASPIAHAPVALTASSPFTVTDNCPTTLEPHTVCQLALTYNSQAAPSADSVTLALDEGLSVLVTGQTLSQSTANGEAVNPSLSVSPATVSFSNAVTVTSTSSNTQTVTIGNTGTAAFPLTLALSGDFTDTTDCGVTLAASSTCSVVITFAPSEPGTRQGLLSATAGAGTSPAYVTLSGTGAGILAANNGTLDFGDVIIGQPEVQWYKITQPFSSLTATTSTGDFKAILVEDLGYGHGQPPASAFTSTASGTCLNCWLGVQFTPSNTGAETASLTLASGGSGSPEPLTLTGTGLPLTGLILTPISQDFGPVSVGSTSPAMLFTLTNLTDAAVSVTSANTSGDFAVSSASTGGQLCTGSVAPNTSCFVEVNFAPTTTGPRTGLLTLATSASTLTSTLTGFGSPSTGLALNPTALTFTNVPGTAATQQTITLTNTGAATLQIGTPTNGNAAFAAVSTCAALAPAATCTVAVTFTPGTAFQADTLEIPVTSTSTGTTNYAVALVGNYTTEDAGLQIIPTQANYGPEATGTLGLTRQFTINNLTAKSLTLAVALPRQFVLSGAPCSGLAPNASCNFSVTFLPLTNGDITGTIFAQGTPTDGSATLNGLGYLEGYGNGSGTLAIAGNLIPNGATGSTLNFGQVASGQTGAQTLTLKNTSTTPLTIRRVTSEWPFFATTTCGTTLAQNQTCTVTVTYSPINQQAAGGTAVPPSNDTGTLVIESDAASSPDLVDLAGSAAPVYVASPSNAAPLASYTASQSSLTFATTQTGNSSAAQAVTLSNTGTTTLHITNLQTTADFTLQSNCGTVVAGASCVINAYFTPQSAGTKISAIEITSDAANALDFISLLGASTPATLTFSPTSLNFDNVLVGSSYTLPIQITNVSTTAATFNGISTTGDYTVAGTCPTPGNVLAPSTSCTLQVTFTPTQTGTRNGTVSIASTASTLSLTAPLTGTGIESHLQISPSALSFGGVAVGASANLSLTLANTGTATVNNVALSITGDYAITVPCTLTALAPGQSCSVTVTFTPTALGSRAGTLTVASSDASSPVSIPLTGTGSPNGTFSLTVNGSNSASTTVAQGIAGSYALAVTPLNGFSGGVVLNCTPLTAGLYATCSLLPSSVILNSGSQTSTATITTVTRVAATQSARNRTNNRAVLCLLPAALLFFWRSRRSRIALRRTAFLWIVIFSAATLTLMGCGSGNQTDPGLRYTPPGTYQYQITASSTSGAQITQSVTVNLTVTQ